MTEWTRRASESSVRSSQEKEDEIKKTDVDDAQWSRLRTYPILRSPKMTREVVHTTQMERSTNR